MDVTKLIDFTLKFEGKKIGIYGTGTGAIKVLNAMGILNQFVYCYFETKVRKEIFINKPVLEGTKDNLNLVDCIIVASEYFNDIEEHIADKGIEIVYYAFKQEKFNGLNRKRLGVSVGRYTYDTYNTLDFPENVESIGSFSSINKRVSIGGKNHPVEYVSTHPMFYYGENGKQNGFSLEGNLEINSKSKIVIGHDVWVSTNAVILPGVTIGHGAVIGAGAVVTKDIPPYAIATGVPAKVIKYRFSEDIIKGLLKIKWWDWSDEKIRNNIHLFYKPKEFVNRFIEEISD